MIMKYVVSGLTGCNISTLIVNNSILCPFPNLLTQIYLNIY